MHGSTASAVTGQLEITRAAVLPRGALIIICILTVFALPESSHAEESGVTGNVRHSVPVPFTVGKRVDGLFYYPCADCHDFMDANRTVRELEVEEGHPAKLEHGNGLIWCFSCHDSTDYGRLQNPLAETIDFDHGYQVCNSCHSQKFLDWTHGGHGKRVGNWHGERQLYSCVECHNPHQPSIPPRAPQPPPPIRAGLNPMTPEQLDGTREAQRPDWEQINER